MQSEDNNLPDRYPDRNLPAYLPVAQKSATLALAAMFEVTNAYGQKWSLALAQGWLAALEIASDVTLGEFQRACAWWSVNEGTFPPVAKLIAWIRVNREDQAAKERLRMAIIEDDIAREQQRESDRRAMHMRIFGKENPSDEELSAWRRKQAAEGKRSRLRSLNSFVIDPEKLKEIEQELSSHGRANR